MDGGAGVSAVPVYNRFVGLAKQIKPHYLSMIMPAKWYNGGRGLDQFRDEMLKDRSIKHLSLAMWHIHKSHSALERMSSL
jgi:hypothetical protein